jgi:hypothetical protein
MADWTRAEELRKRAHDTYESLLALRTVSDPRRERWRVRMQGRGAIPLHPSRGRTYGAGLRSVLPRPEEEDSAVGLR